MIIAMALAIAFEHDHAVGIRGAVVVGGQRRQDTVRHGYPRHKLGNVMNQSLGAMVNSPQQIKFGDDKFDSLPKFCRECEVRFACNGECPKHRFIQTPDGEDGLNYLCAAYKKFFNHIDPHMKTMAQLLQNDEAPARIMEILAKKPL
jgi:uncharacterized protein